MRRLLLVLFSLIISCFVYAEDEVQPEAASGETVAEQAAAAENAPASAFSHDRPFIGNVMSSGADEHYTLVVEKIPHMLYVLRIDGDSQQVVDNFSVLTGRNDGNKALRGDERTPEGVYYTVSYMDQSTMRRMWGEIAYRYGIGAYPLNYPNPIDRIRKKTGSGIWVHGLDPERQKPVTEGCVGVQNGDLERIKPVMGVGMPVVIIDNATFMTGEEYAASRKEQLGQLDSFIGAWAYGDFDTFQSHIHPEYSSYAGATAKAYLEKKKQLMALYPEKSIEIENINIYKQNSHTLVYDFDQFYCAPNTVTFGNKRFYLENDNGSYKVISEEIASKAVYPYLEPRIKSFLAEWQAAWESKDIDKYMSYYGSRFKGLDKWRETKESVFEKTENISVGIKNVRWEMQGGDRIQITFLQDYTSDSLSDSGVKRLAIAGCPGSYKIESEEWSAH